MVLLLFYYRTKLFSSFVQEAALNTTSTFNLKRYIVMYSRNLDSLKETDGCVKPMIFVHLISSFVNTLVLFYNVVITLYKSVSSLDTLFFLIGTSIQVIYNCLILFIPSVIIELITKDLEALKNDLADKILTCGDRRRREQLRMLQLYLHDKPFTYTLWRSIQVNSRLPLKFLSLVATCLICMLQISVKNK
nr:uncharacterized protein LOC116773104 [Danaus plexippus plexippus]